MASRVKKNKVNFKGKMVRDVNEIKPTYSPELKKTFRNNSSNLKNAIGILKNATI